MRVYIRISVSGCEFDFQVSTIVDGKNFLISLLPLNALIVRREISLTTISYEDILVNTEKI